MVEWMEGRERRVRRREVRVCGIMDDGGEGDGDGDGDGVGEGGWVARRRSGASRARM